MESGLQRHSDERGPATTQRRIYQHQDHEGNYTECRKNPVRLTEKNVSQVKFTGFNEAKYSDLLLCS